MSIADRVRIALRPRGREAFIRSLPPGAAVLDIGCGSNSPCLVKTQRPDLHYVGIDVGDYDQAQDPRLHADEYIVCGADEFADAITALGRRFDAVISSHNIEHCDKPANVLAAMGAVLRPGGRVYMAWPAEHTVTLPSRGGCLNFYDDPGHREMPRFAAIVAALKSSGLEPVFGAEAYRPPIPFLIGMMLEPLCARFNRQAPLRSTWAFYGFEAVLWMKAP